MAIVQCGYKDGERGWRYNVLDLSCLGVTKVEIDSRKTILKICIPTVAGLLIGIYFYLPRWRRRVFAHFADISDRTCVRITRIGPWMIAFLRSMFKAMASLFLFRMFLWAIVILILVPHRIGAADTRVLDCWVPNGGYGSNKIDQGTKSLR